MKILHVTPYFYPAFGYGGTPRVAYDLARALARRGHPITIFTTDTLNPRQRVAFSFKKIRRMEIYYFKNLFNSLLGLVKFPIAPKLLKQKKALEQFDLIHLHEFRTFQNIVVSRWAQKLNIPYVITAHGSLEEHGAFRLGKKIFDEVFGFKILKGAARHLALSSQEKKVYSRFHVPSSRIDLVANGISLPEFNKTTPPYLFRNKCRLGASPFILFLGRINPIKGLDFLIKVFSQVARKNNQVKLVMAGPDEHYQAFLEDQIRKRKLQNLVIFPGPVHGLVKIAALKEANLFVYPSRYEVFGLAPLEAIAARTPVIISSRCGIADLFQQKKLGLVKAYGHTSAWSQSIIQIIENPDKGKAPTEEAYQYLQNNLTWEKIALQYEEIYRKILRGK